MTLGDFSPFGTPCYIRVPHCHTLYLLMYNKYFLKHFKVKYHTFGCNIQLKFEILGANKQNLPILLPEGNINTITGHPIVIMRE